MEEQEQNQKQDLYQDMRSRNRAGKILGGFFIVGVGIIFLLKQMGYFLPGWLFTWPCLLIAIGAFILLRSGMRNIGGLIVILVGGVFLYERIFPGTSISPFIWPAAIIIVGLFMIFTPHHNHWQRHQHRRWRRWQKYSSREDWKKYKDDWKNYKGDMKFGDVDPVKTTSGDDYIDIVSVFGGTHKVIVSKNFKGGDMVNIFGGSELNLSQADINGIVTIDSTQIFGGAKLIVPSNWEIRSEVAAIFGGIEDKRPHGKAIANPDKILVITGASIFGGLEILSY